MLIFQDVLLNKDKYRKVLKVPSIYTVLSLLLLVVGCLNSYGYLFNQPSIKGLGIVTVASPLPLVFSSHNGIETFSTEFLMNVTYADSQTNEHQEALFPLNHEIYSQIQGPYNRRNAYGVLFSHGPFFLTRELINLRQEILQYAVCKNGLDLDYEKILGVDNNITAIKKAEIIVTSKTKGNENKNWKMSVTCNV